MSCLLQPKLKLKESAKWRTEKNLFISLYTKACGSLNECYIKSSSETVSSSM